MFALFSILSGVRSAVRPVFSRGVALAFVLVSMAVLMTACLPLPEETSPDDAKSPAAMDATEEALVEQATADLAEQLGVDADAIKVTSIEAVDWGDSSLGCPQEGMMYAAVITPGYQITLTHDGINYIYHTGADVDSPIIGCTAGGEVAEAGTELAAGSTEEMLVTLATEDLAAQLGVDADDIEVASVEAMDWHDSSLGCPQEGMMYSQVITPGYQITLTYDDVDYIYHTGADADSPIIGCTAGEEVAEPQADTEPPAGSTEETLVTLATEDLAAQLGVDADDIEVASVEAMDWHDSSLGCPQEGMMYSQVITPGYQITLTYDGVDYIYHTGADADSPIIGCTKGGEVVGGEAAEAGTEPAAGSTEEMLVTLATEDLAAQLGVDADDIEVVSVEAMDWHDSSLGCPQEDMMYSQVITPGYQITLTYDGVDYIYHTGADADSPIIGCTKNEEIVGGEAAVPASDTGEIASMPTIRDTLIAQAKEDLAQRQGVETSEIEVKSVQAVEWRDGSLGCAKAGMMYPQVITPGYRITLTIDGVDYAYHTGGREDGQVKYCRTPSKSNDGDSYRTE